MSIGTGIGIIRLLFCLVQRKVLMFKVVSLKLKVSKLVQATLFAHGRSWGSILANKHTGRFSDHYLLLFFYLFYFFSFVMFLIELVVESKKSGVARA